jgi:hypothetical protein
MTTLGKTLFVALSLAVVIAGTLALRSAEPEAASQAQLTPAQMAEIQPAVKPVEPPKARAAVDDAEPLEPEIEDGSGS